MASSTHTIVPRTAVRAFLIAAIASLVGAGLLVMALAEHWHAAVVVVGSVIMVAGLLLLLAAFLAQRAGVVKLVLDDDGYTLMSRGGSQSGRWAEVTRITRSVEGGQVTVHEGEEKRTRLEFHSNDRTQIDEVLAEMGERLDTAKGYEPWADQ